MSGPVVSYMELPCDDGGGHLLDAPSRVRVRLDAHTVGLIEDVIGTYKSGKKRKFTEYQFPKEALEYLRPDSGRWEREFENATISADDDELALNSEVMNRWGDRAEHVLYAKVEYADLEQEIRQWRSQVMGVALEDAMSDDQSPAPRAAGMSPL